MLTKISALACAFMMSGCSAINNVNPFDDEHVNPVGAGPLFPATTSGKGDATTSSSVFVEGADDYAKRQKLAQLVAQSISECDQFRKHMVITVDSVDTLSDIATTTLSALATAFTPLATTHALSAAATIVSGNKAVIDSDIYAKASLSNLVSALTQTYYLKIAQFNASIPTLDLSTPDVALNQLMLIHSQCSLDAIEASIGSILVSPNSGGTPPPDSGAQNTEDSSSSPSSPPGGSQSAPAAAAPLPPMPTSNNFTGPGLLPGGPNRQ